MALLDELKKIQQSKESAQSVPAQNAGGDLLSGLKSIQAQRQAYEDQYLLPTYQKRAEQFYKSTNDYFTAAQNAGKQLTGGFSDKAVYSAMPLYDDTNYQSALKYAELTGNSDLKAWLDAVPQNVENIENFRKNGVEAWKAFDTEQDFAVYKNNTDRQDKFTKMTAGELKAEWESERNKGWGSDWDVVYSLMQTDVPFDDKQNYDGETAHRKEVQAKRKYIEGKYGITADDYYTYDEKLKDLLGKLDTYKDINTAYVDENGNSVTYANLYYAKDNEEKLASLAKDTAALKIYEDAKTMQDDLKLIDEILQSDIPSAENTEVRQGYVDQGSDYKTNAKLYDKNVAYIAEKYGVDLDSAEALYDREQIAEELKNTIKQNVKQAIDELKKDGYDYQRLYNYEQTMADKADAEKREKSYRYVAENYPFLAAVASALMALPSAVEYWTNNSGSGSTPTPENIDTYAPKNTYGNSASQFSQVSQSVIANKISEDIKDLTGSDTLAWLASTGYSGITSALSSRLMMEVCIALASGGEPTAVGSAASALGEWMSLFIMGSNAANQALSSALERGADNGSAALYSFAAGLNEVLFEKVSLDAYLSNKTVWDSTRIFQSVLDGLKSAAAQGGVEASEEVFTTLANTLADGIINGSQSEYQADVQKYLQQGFSAEEAKQKASEAWIIGVLGDAFGGFVGGAAGGGLKIAGNTFSSMLDQDAATARQINRQDGTGNPVLSVFNIQQQMEQSNLPQEVKDQVLNEWNNLLVRAQNNVSTVDQSLATIESILNDNNADKSAKRALTIMQNLSEQFKAEVPSADYTLKANPVKAASPSVNASASGLQYNGSPVAIERVESVSPRTVKVRLNNGEVVNASDLQTSDQNLADLFALIPKNFDAQQATVILNGYTADVASGVDPQLYASAAKAVYNAGVQGISESNLGNLATLLPEAVRSRLYNAGVNAQQTTAQNAQRARLARQKTQATENTTAQQNATQSASQASLKEQQKSAQEIARKAGFSVVFEDLPALENGFLDGSGVIHINNAAQNPVRVVLVHELTHYAENSKRYSAFARAITDSGVFAEWLSDKGYTSAEDFVQDLMARRALNGEKYTLDRTQARQEMIAQFCESTLFADDTAGLERFLSQMTEPKRNAFVEHIQRFFAWLKNKLSKQSLDEVEMLEKRFTDALKSVERGESADDGVRYSANNLVDLYTEKQYNNYGWVRVNNVLSAAAYARFSQNFASAVSKHAQFVRTASGEYIIPTGDIDGVNNLLVYASGTIQNPKISKVVKINFDDETNIDNVRRIIYDQARKGLYESQQIVENYYKQGVLDTLSRSAYPTFQESSGQNQGRNSQTRNSFGRTLQNGERGREGSLLDEDLTTTSQEKASSGAEASGEAFARSDANRRYSLFGDSNGNGYSGFSMSNNAVAAYESGEKPLSKWTKAEILSAVEEINPQAVEYLKPINAATLREHLLSNSSWHHTGYYYNKTDFYALDEDVVSELTQDAVNQWTKIADKKPEDTETFRGNIDYVEWSGSRNHPKATNKRLENVVIQKRGSFYRVLADNGNEILRKKIGSNGTRVISNEEMRKQQERENAYRIAREARNQAYQDNSSKAALELLNEWKQSVGVEESRSGHVYPLGHKPSSWDYDHLDRWFEVGEKRLFNNEEEQRYEVETWDGAKWVKDENGQKYSLNETELSKLAEETDSRTVLSRALETVAQTDADQKIIADYQKQIDTLNELQDELDTVRYDIKTRSFERGARDMDAIRDLQSRRDEIEQKINRADRSLLKLESTQALKDLMQREKARSAKLSKQEARETMQRYRDRAETTRVKNKIKKIANDLEQRLRRGSERTAIPVNLVNGVIDVINEIDPTGRNQNTKVAARRQNALRSLAELRGVYDALQRSNDPVLTSIYDEQFSQQIAYLQEAIGNKPLRDLSLPELQDVYDILRDIQFTIQDANHLIGWTDRANVYQTGEAFIDNMRQVKDLKLNGNLVSNFLRNWTLNPYRGMLEMSGFDENSPLAQMQREINDGIRKRDYWKMTATKPFEDLLRGKENERLAQEAQTQEIDFGLKNRDGETVKLTKMQAIQLLLTYYREQANPNRRHLENFVLIPDAELQNKGEMQQALDKAKDVVIEPAVVERIPSKLNNWDKRYMKAAQYLFQKASADAINEVSLQTKRRPIATEKEYTPYEVDKDYVASENSNLKFNASLNSRGILQNVIPNASNPLVIRGLNYMVDKHINEVAEIYGLSIPVQNWNKIWNMKETGEDGGASVKAAVRSVWGNEGIKFLEQTIADLQTSRQKESTFMDKYVRPAFVQATLAANVSVAVKQAASYVAAGSRLSAKSLAKGFAKYATKMKNGLKAQDVWSDIDQLTAANWKRRQGLEIQEVAEAIMHSKWSRFLNKKLGKLSPMNWIQAVDVATTSALWYACQEEVKSQGLKSGTEEYRIALRNLYDSVLEETQPMYDPFYRGEITKGATRRYFMFQTQPLQNSGILRSATLEYEAARKRYGAKSQAAKSARKRMGQAYASQVASHAVFVAMTILGSMLLNRVGKYRDKDTGEVKSEKIVEAFAAGLGENLIGAMVPVAGNLIMQVVENAVNGTDYDIVTDPGIGKINDTLKNVTNILSGKGGINSIVNAVTEVAGLFGIPAANAYKLGKGIELHVRDVIDGQLFSFEASADRKVSQTTEEMYQAMVNGNASQYFRMREDLGEDKASGKLKEAIKAHYLVGELNGQDATKYLTKYAGTEAQDAYWLINKWQYMRDNGGSEEGYSKYGDFFQAVDTGGGALNSAIQNYTKNGVDTATLASQITQHYKAQYIAASPNARSNLKAKLLNAYAALGYDRSKKSQDIDKWLVEK